MILSDRDIKNKTNGIILEPYCEECVQPASYDCHLGNDFLIIPQKKFHEQTLVIGKTELSYDKLVLNDNEVIEMSPHEFILGTTKEYVKIPSNITAFVEGRSSIGRCGLFIQNAGLIDAGFDGNITLELYNANDFPIAIPVGCRICQLVFMKMTTGADVPYRGKYQNQRGTTGSKVNEDIEFQR